MNMHLLRLALKAGTFALAMLAAAAALAHYPSQPVRIVIGFPPGGTTDVIGRLVAQGLAESLGKSFIVDNRGGASGTIGTGIVAKSEPNGYTLLIVSSTHGTAPALYSSLPYQEKDLAPVGLIATTPYVFVVHPTIPANTFQELLTLLRQNPGKYSFASSSPGTAQHLGGELVKRMAGVDMVHVPYKSARRAAARPALGPRADDVRERRDHDGPHQERLAAAARGLEREAHAAAARRADGRRIGTRRIRGARLVRVDRAGKHAAGRDQASQCRGEQAHRQPAIVERFAALGAEPLGGTPERAAAFIKGEQDKWGKIIRDTGIKAD